ncbi:hypothetical protein AB0B28_08335 [Glycomyces sp. NPDC046736]|uniref:hypothetical protein n=1 Tax=Glycomyces sp. NPDC046736 TaxID=3155615 RepID=UPI0033EB3B61
MPRTDNPGPGRDLPAFGRWLRRTVDALARAEGVSHRKFMEDRDVNRANVSRWYKLTNEMAGPTRETVEREFDRLGISDEDRAEPYGHLGWAVSSSGERLSSLEAKRRRAEALLRLNLSPAQRAEYKRMLGDYEAAHEALLDRFFERAEADMRQAREDAEGGHPNE